MLLFLQGVWSFIKKYWQLLVGLGVGLSVFLLSIRPKNTTPPEVDGFQKKVEDETKKEEQKAEQELKNDVVSAKKEHDDVVDKAVDAEKKRTEDLIDDPDATNDFLKQVGQDIRGK